MSGAHVPKNCTFKVEITGAVKAYGLFVLERDSDDVPEPVDIDFQTGIGELPLMPGYYRIYWQFWGAIGSGLKISILNDDDAPLRPPITDTLHSGSGKFDENEFVVV